MRKLKVGIIGATGMVGQRFITLLANHPYFEIAALAAGPRSSGRSYREAVAGRWKLSCPCPEEVLDMPVLDASDVAAVGRLVDFVFCAVNLPKSETLALEELYARHEIPVVSNNSANRWTPDVPMLIPEVNPEHAEVIAAQRARLGTKRGFIAVKPNCSIQGYVGALTPLRKYGIEKIAVTTYQAVSGAGRTLSDWEEMTDNIIPYIPGEEEKSEREPLRVWGEPDVEGLRIVPADEPVISAQCLRVPVSDGHMAAVFVKFREKPTVEEIKTAWRDFTPLPERLSLPSAPERFLTYFEEPDRPQTRLDRGLYSGMGISVGRLREDRIFDYSFVTLAHNTLRGAAGGAVLMAELLVSRGYLTPAD